MIHDDIDDEEERSAINNNSWNSETYAAWIRRFGKPEDVAGKIIADPMKMLSSLKDQFADVHGKKILNIMGSNGIKGIALAVLGAKVTIVDFSGENKRYALKVAEAAKANIAYIQSDILKIKECTQTARFDIAFAEMGILHYFTDLQPFMNIIYDILEDGGKFIIKDFHPISTKLIAYRGSTAKVRKYKVTGDYFDSSIEKVEVAFSKHLPANDDVHYVYIRKWTLGEIVTAVAKAGLIIESLKEEPNQSSEVFDKGIPKTFTIISKRS
ncbi:MAG: methyltransferase domain-containing protein [Spirochaetales bacterium]